MRITARQLRQIIKEELQREVDSSGYDINPDLSGLPDEPMVKMAPKRADVPDILARGEGEGPAALMTLTRWYSPADESIARDLLLSPSYKMVANKILSNVSLGKSVMKMGDRGDAVKIMQLLIKAKLVQQLNNLSSSVATDVALGGMGGGIESNSKSVAQRALSGAVVSNADLESATADALDRLNAGGAGPDGIYGPTTRDAVAIMQEYMQQNNREGYPGEVDGIIGRQTMSYIIGKAAIGAITGA